MITERALDLFLIRVRTRESAGTQLIGHEATTNQLLMTPLRLPQNAASV